MVGICYLKENKMLNKGPTKPFATFEEQLSLLKSRGLNVDDDKKALSVLKSISYYRFSGYSLSLRDKENNFHPNISFDNIHELYMFDEKFRSIIMQYCGIVEISFRSYLSYFHSQKYNPLGYLEPNNFEDAPKHSDFLKELEKEINRSNDYFIQHHKKERNSIFPFWVVIEVISFGVLSKLYKNMKTEDRNQLAKEYVGYKREYIENWLQCCSYARNIAAHGGRFYNRLFQASKVKINKKRYPNIDNSSSFALIIAIYNLLPSDNVKNTMVSDIQNCFHSFDFALPKYLGFPEKWEELLLKKAEIIQS